jgi:hypothetical protein
MKHPTAEEWMSLLYGEASPQQKTQLNAHLAQCAECETRTRAWRRGMNALNAWPNNHHTQTARFGPLATWAGAAVLVIGLVFAAGRYSASNARDLEAVKASLRAEFQQQLDATQAALMAERQHREQAILASARTDSVAQADKLLGEFVRANAEQRRIDLQSIYTAMTQLETKRQQDYATLRRELETVAVLTENSLVQLAGYRSSDASDRQSRTP